ncbi:aminotransferase class V-fold PLP-dependent enzyme [Crateriforma conspicua]|uniref:Cysteine desulfurase n=1 Tax=Crateriforma conspicua TaxID=2527996 RepID=A0A5C6FST8_9PLAN|nr:aminotransferase class V-fold PLP-dependent enzyme [Crateriforma conspicua]TWU66067.1 Cysteine desulfurase [Crateriforma conspicua]
MNSTPAPENSSSAPPTSTADDLLRRDPWLWWRNQMPITAKWHYFDHAAVAPLPKPAADAITKFATQASEEGDTVWPQWHDRQETLRGQFAELTGASIDEVCLIPNTTTGINLVAEGWPWQPGDSVVVPEGEYPSNLLPWLNQQSKGVDVRIVPRRDGRVEIDDLFDRVDDSTQMIAVSWVGFSSGYRVDLETLVHRAHRRGVKVFVDAIQGLGMYPLDLSQIPVDFLAADGHKWLLGPEGAGVAVVARRHLETLRCIGVGWHSVKESKAFTATDLDLRPTAARFEGGSANMVGFAALSASVELFLQVRRMHGANAIADRVIGLVDGFEGMLRERGLICHAPVGSMHRTGIVIFEVPGVDAAKVRQSALDSSMVISCRGAGVRASIHAYNTLHELEQLADLAAGLAK